MILMILLDDLNLRDLASRLPTMLLNVVQKGGHWLAIEVDDVHI